MVRARERETVRALRLWPPAPTVGQSAPSACLESLSLSLSRLENRARARACKGGVGHGRASGNTLMHTSHRGHATRTFAACARAPHTGAALAAVHIEQPPRRRKAVAVPAGRRDPGRGRREVGPVARGGVVGVEIVEVACRTRQGQFKTKQTARVPYLSSRTGRRRGDRRGRLPMDPAAPAWLRARERARWSRGCARESEPVSAAGCPIQKARTSARARAEESGRGGIGVGVGSMASGCAGRVREATRRLVRASVRERACARAHRGRVC